MSDDKKQDNLLLSATQWQKRSLLHCRRAGDEAICFLRRHERDYNRNASLIDAWESILPPGLKPWCRLDRRTGNVLIIQAAPGPYMHQMNLMQGELLDELHRCCPEAGIQKLRIIPLKNDIEES